MAVFAKTPAADTGRHDNVFDMIRYLDLLSEIRKAPTGIPPATGVAPEWEKLLSAASIRPPRYGIRASTILRIRRDECSGVTERHFDAQGQIDETRYFGVLDTVIYADIQALSTQTVPCLALVA